MKNCLLVDKHLNRWDKQENLKVALYREKIRKNKWLDENYLGAIVRV